MFVSRGRGWRGTLVSTSLPTWVRKRPVGGYKETMRAVAYGTKDSKFGIVDRYLMD